MRCFTDAELRRGLDAVIAGHDRCVICQERRHPFASGRLSRHDQGASSASRHSYVAPDVLDLFLAAAVQTPADADEGLFG